MSDTPTRVAIVLDAVELDVINAMYYVGLTVREDGTRESFEVGIREVKSAPDFVVARIARKLFHANEVIRRKRNG